MSYYILNISNKVSKSKYAKNFFKKFKFTKIFVYFLKYNSQTNN